MNETKMNEETLTNAERAEQQVKMSFGPNAKHEILTTKSGISYNLTVVLESKELAEVAIRALMATLDDQEDEFKEITTQLHKKAAQRNKELKEYEEIRDLAVKETCKEKTTRVRLEQLHEAALARNEELMEKITLKKVRIQELESRVREQAYEKACLANEKKALSDDRDFWRTKYAEYDSEQPTKYPLSIEAITQD